jgi:hypothetical protein
MLHTSKGLNLIRQSLSGCRSGLQVSFGNLLDGIKVPAVNSFSSKDFTIRAIAIALKFDIVIVDVEKY